MQKHTIKKKYGFKNIKVIGNPISLKNKKLNQRENIIITVGRLIKSKNHDRLIKIFSKINNINWKLIIIGSDALDQNNRKDLHNLIKKYNLQKNVKLVGTVKNVEKYYSNSKIFAFTSSSEGFPNVLLEALSYNLPVISYDCISGPSDIIKNDVNGYLINQFNDSLFQKKLDSLMSDPIKLESLSQNCSKSIEKFSEKNIAKKYLDFILGK